MEQHPVPRQITTFEFKLIGFLTLKQFIYLIVFGPIGFIVYRLFPIPLLNILFGVMVGGAGAAFAFLPVNDRPLDVWIRNLFKRLTSPTQYLYLKKNPPIYFLKNLFFLADPHRILTHVQSQEKLALYLAKTKAKVGDNKKQLISGLLQKSNEALGARREKSAAKTDYKQKQKTTQSQEASLKTARPAFLTGLVKNHKLIPLPGVLIYIKDERSNTLRLLKTNPHGIFATFSRLPEGEYLFEMKDPRNTYFFDTMKIKVEKENPAPLEFFSKELM